MASRLAGRKMTVASAEGAAPSGAPPAASKSGSGNGAGQWNPNVGPLSCRNGTGSTLSPVGVRNGASP